MMDFAAFPNAEPDLISSRSISPVEIAGIFNQLEILPDCVPLPLPGGPKSRRTKLSSVPFKASEPTDSCRDTGQVLTIRQITGKDYHYFGLRVPVSVRIGSGTSPPT